MKSILVIVVPLVLVTLLAGLIYMYKTGMIEEMLAQTQAPAETVTPLPEEKTDAGKEVKHSKTPNLSDVDISTAEGLLRARDIVRASLETQKPQKREELDRQHGENPETRRIKKLKDGMDGWLKRID